MLEAKIETKTKMVYNFKKARIGMNAQSIAHIMIIVFIILGNIGYFLTEHKKNKNL